jgi:hypothetical protein
MNDFNRLFLDNAATDGSVLEGQSVPPELVIN